MDKPRSRKVVDIALSHFPWFWMVKGTMGDIDLLS